MVIKDLWKYYADELVFKEVNATIGNADRIGLVGANGIGKTTLLQVLAGIIPHEQGEIMKGKQYKIGYFVQDLSWGEQTLQMYLETPFQELIELGDNLKELEQSMSDPEIYKDSDELSKAMEKYGRYQHRWEEQGGYDYQVRIKSAALGLGFLESDLDRPMHEFSGGEKIRAQLGNLLLSQPDLLMLDEPTNHLDVEATEWVEAYLINYPKAVLVVSHDRYSLDRVATKVWENNRT